MWRDRSMLRGLFLAPALAILITLPWLHRPRWLKAGIGRDQTESAVLFKLGPASQRRPVFE